MSHLLFHTIARHLSIAALTGTLVFSLACRAAGPSPKPPSPRSSSPKPPETTTAPPSTSTDTAPQQAESTAEPPTDGVTATSYERPVWPDKEALQPSVDLFSAGEWNEAEERLLAYFAQNPKSAGATFYLGRVYFEQGRYGKAIEVLESSLAIEPQDVETHLWLGKALSEEIERAVMFRQLPLARRLHEAFLQAVELDPQRTEAHIALARFYSEAPPLAGGDPAKALRHATILAQLDALGGQHMLATLHERWNQLEQAEEAWLKAIEVDPKPAKSRGQAAAFFTRQQMHPKAAEMYEQTLAVQTTSTSDNDERIQIRLRLGQAYELLNEDPKAAEQYRAILQQKPDHKEANEALVRLGASLDP